MKEQSNRIIHTEITGMTIILSSFFFADWFVLLLPGYLPIKNDPLKGYIIVLL